VVTADEDGRFEFKALEAGAFRIIASKTGYVPIPSEPAVAGPPLLSTGRHVELAAGEIRERVEVPLARWGTLAGRVLDELGDPVQGARVEVLEVRYRAGRRWLVRADAAPRVTDDTWTTVCMHSRLAGTSSASWSGRPRSAMGRDTRQFVREKAGRRASIGG
jgi:hypothetical protein